MSVLVWSSEHSIMVAVLMLVYHVILYYKSILYLKSLF